MSGNVTPLYDAADRRRAAAPQDQSAFVSNIFSVLERTEYRRCESGEDLEDIYRLRYKAYRRTDMVPESSLHAIHDDLDDQSNCHRFGIYIDGALVSTLRLHHVSAAESVSPSTTVYPDILMPRLAAGETFVDPSRFAADPEWTRSYPQIPYITLRLAGMASMYFETPYCLSTIRPDHTGFYRRIYRSEQIGSLRDYPGLNYQVVLYEADVEAIRVRSFARFPFFRSTPMEQRLMFGRAARGELAPLTILPTARYAA